MDTKYLFMRPIIWLIHREVPYVNVEIVQNFYNAYFTPKLFFVEKDFDSWYPQIHVPCNYLQSFYVAAIIDKCDTTKDDPLATFRNGTPKKYEIIFYRQDGRWNSFFTL